MRDDEFDPRLVAAAGITLDMLKLAIVAALLFALWIALPGDAAAAELAGGACVASERGIVGIMVAAAAALLVTALVAWWLAQPKVEPHEPIEHGDIG